MARLIKVGWADTGTSSNETENRSPAEAFHTQVPKRRLSKDRCIRSVK